MVNSSVIDELMNMFMIMVALSMHVWEGAVSGQNYNFAKLAQRWKLAIGLCEHEEKNQFRCAIKHMFLVFIDFSMSRFR